MTVYYNEFDNDVADGLESLILAGEIPDGVVDRRSIVDVEPSDLKDFNAWHFFAGIGGWPLALRMAGFPDEFRVWTGSPPCQPFSIAGKQKGKSDPRHLAPKWLQLVAECQPRILFGEQVKDAIQKHWLDDLYDKLEMEGYAVGSAVLPGCVVGAPHKRDRILFGAHRLDVPDSVVEHWCEVAGGFGTAPGSAIADWPEVTVPWEPGGAVASVLRGMADANGIRLEGVGSDRHPGRREGQDVGPHGVRSGTRLPGDNATHHMPWGVVDWVCGGDGKWRPIEPGLMPVVNGISNIVGSGESEVLRLARRNKTVRLKGYGNAIIPSLAAEFIRAFTLAIGDSRL